MSKAVAPRSRHGLSLVIALSAVTLAALVLRRAGPSDVGVRAATAAALVIVLVALLASGSTRCVMPRHRVARPEPDLARNLLAAIPDGCSSSRRAASDRSTPPLQPRRVRSPRICSRPGAPLPFWPPEHAHEIARWHEELAERGEHRAGVDAFRHRMAGGCACSYRGRAMSRRGRLARTTSRSTTSPPGTRRERRLQALATRDVQTGLLDRGEFERRLGDAVRRAMSNETNVAVVLAELTLAGRPDGAGLRKPGGGAHDRTAPRARFAPATSSRGPAPRARDGSSGYRRARRRRRRRASARRSLQSSAMSP